METVPILWHKIGEMLIILTVGLEVKLGMTSRETVFNGPSEEPLCAGKVSVSELGRQWERENGTYHHWTNGITSL